MIATLLAALALQSGSDADWLLVRSRADAVGPLAWERIGELYLAGRAWELVPPGELGERAPTSRMVVGTPYDLPGLGSLAAELGVTFADGRLAVAGEAQPDGTGFAALVLDPDGAGTLFLACGADAEGLLANFRTNLGLDLGQFALTRDGRRLSVGPLARRFALERPLVVRLDLEYRRLLESASGSASERALHVGRGLVGYAHVLSRLGAGDLWPFAERLMANEPALARADRFFAGRDPGGEVLVAWETVRHELGLAPEREPVFYVAYGPPGTSNAMNFGDDPVTGRRQVLFNLTELARGEHFRSALMHECVHVLQRFGGERLVDRAMAEGVATACTQALVYGLSDADALLWADADLAAARSRRAELVRAFLADAQRRDRGTLDEWLTLGAAPPEVPGAPARSGYFVAWLAARAWLEADTERDLADLLAVPADELLAALPRD